MGVNLRIVTRLSTGSDPARTFDSVETLRDAISTELQDFDEPLRQLRAFTPKRKPRIERVFAAAYAALCILHDERDAPTPLQSLTYGWLAPLWVALGLSRQDADTEIDGGKCDGSRPDPRIASMLALDF